MVDAVADLLVRLCLSGPLLWIGLSMCLDPIGFARLLVTLAHVLHTFEQRFGLSQSSGSLESPDELEVSARAQTALRVGGVLVALGALMNIVVIV